MTCLITPWNYPLVMAVWKVRGSVALHVCVCACVLTCMCGDAEHLLSLVEPANIARPLQVAPALAAGNTCVLKPR